MSIDSTLASPGAFLSGDFDFSFGNTLMKCILTNSLGNKYALVADNEISLGHVAKIIHVDKSTNGGASWSNVGAATRTITDVGFDVSFDGFGVYPFGNKFYVLCFGNFSGSPGPGPGLSLQIFDTIAETWSSIPITFLTNGAPDGGVVVKSTGTIVIFFSPAGTDQPAVSEWSGSTWSTPVAPSWGSPGFSVDNFPVMISLANNDRVRLFVSPYSEAGTRGKNLLHCSWDGSTFGTVQTALSDFWTGADPPIGNPGPICMMGQGLGYIDGTSNKKFAIPYFTYNTTPHSGGVISSSTLNDGGSGWIVGETFEIDDGNFDGEGVVDSVDGTGKILTYHLTAFGTDYPTELIDAYSTSGAGVDLLLDIVASPIVPYSVDALVVKCLHGNDDVADPTWFDEVIETSPNLESPGPYTGYGSGLYPYVRENKSSLVASGGTLRMFYAVDDFNSAVGYIKKADWNGPAWTGPSIFRSGDFSTGRYYTWSVTGIDMDTALLCIGGPADWTHIYAQDGSVVALPYAHTRGCRAYSR